MENCSLLILCCSLALQVQIVTSCIANHKRCGSDRQGILGSCCSSNFECRRQSQWFYQCTDDANDGPLASEFSGQSPTPSPSRSRSPARAPKPEPSSQTQTGTFTRYWDCCKPSCSWSSNLEGSFIDSPVKTCDSTGLRSVNTDRASVCAGGGFPAPPTSTSNLAFTCNTYQPFIASNGDLRAFGASANKADCCRCIEADIPNGKKMVAQVINTGTDVGKTQFDIQVPGGGLGIFDGCSRDGSNEERKIVWEPPELRGRNGHMFDHPSSEFGVRYGGVWSGNKDCSNLPSEIQEGCEVFRRFSGGVKDAVSYTSNNLRISFRYVTCPVELTERSECRRSDV